VATEAITSPFPGISVVPSSCRVRLDRRLLPGEQERDVLAEVRHLIEQLGVDADVGVTSEPVHTYTGELVDHRRFLPAWRIAAEQPLARAAMRAVGAGHDVYRFCTNGSLTASRGIPTVGFGPGDPEMAHRPDEWIALEDLRTAAAGYTALAEMTDWKDSA
jgi:acetylornithine deacetylase/succinyl-diaminopimelate desuccinylase-like protein